jgi:hypothetical protein
METDADRLASIKALGGQLITSAYGQFWGIFDREFALSIDGSVETRQPVLEARTLDVEDIPKDAVIQIGSDNFRVKRSEPDGTGMTMLVLKR